MIILYGIAIVQIPNNIARHFESYLRNECFRSTNKKILKKKKYSFFSRQNADQNFALAAMH